MRIYHPAAILLCTLWPALVWAQPQVVASNIGPSNAYDIAAGFGIGEANGGGQVSEFAVSFKPPFDALFDSVELPITLMSGSRVSAVDVSLVLDDGGLPGAPVEAFPVRTNLQEFGTNAPLLVLQSSLRPHLQAGQRYWLRVTHPEPTRSTAVWNLALVDGSWDLATPENPIASRYTPPQESWSASPGAPRPAFRISGTRVASCLGPTLLFADYTGTSGFVVADVTNSHIDGSSRTGTLTVSNYLPFWIGVSDILPSNGATIAADASAGLKGEFAAAQLLRPCDARFIVSCTTPGQAVWTVTFCSPGNIGMTLGITPTAASIQVLDFLLSKLLPVPAPITTLVSLASKLDDLPAFRAIGQCATQNQRRIFACEARAFRDLLSDSDQLFKLDVALAEVGIAVDVKVLLKQALGVAPQLLVLEGNLIAFLYETNRDDHPGTMFVNVEGR
jgi:hypothetical protein